MKTSIWPELPDYKTWKNTCDTLQRWIQIVGKVRTTTAPWINHGWHSTLYLTSRGLTTSLIPGTDRNFSIDFDFIHHQLQVRTSDGQERIYPLKAEPVASFYNGFRKIMSDLEIELDFYPRANEVPDTTPFAEDTAHRSYDPLATRRFWETLIPVNQVFQEFRSRFVGKCSPVHFFWGSLDLAVTRFSGRRAPEHPGGFPTLPDLVTREAYSHEVSSCGFWPGNDLFPSPAFYSYAYPHPEGFEKIKIAAPNVIYHPTLKEFILPYDEVRKSSAPEKLLLLFLQGTYEGAANLGGWDRDLLENSPYLKALQEKQKKKLTFGKAA